MSDEQSNNTAEESKKVVITPEEVNSALDFWKHFQIPVPAGLQAAYEAFKLDPSFENQQKVKLAVTLDISTSSHEAFMDEMFSKIREECGSVAFDMQFDEDIKETLTVKE